MAVNCGEPASTCFCSSMNAGPRVGDGFDLALTELASDGGSRFLLEVGSERGAALAAELETRPASEPDLAAAEAVLAQAEARIGRRLELAGLKQLLAQHYDDPHWDEVAKRCLTCANCTLVCPTCFCTAVDDVSDLTGAQAERRRRWDSCFTLDFSYIHGGSVRTSAGARYRQWLTHKLGTWQDQFGTSGCVGCGRCITWCPVGIDITAEVAALASAAGATGGDTMIENFEKTLAAHAFFKDMPPAQLGTIVGCAANVRFAAGELIFREGDPADTFYILRKGKVAVEITIPGRGQVTIDTADGDEVLGWSWLFAPYRAHFDVRAMTVVQALGLDGACLRGKFEKDTALGYELMRRFAPVLIQRLEATRLQLLDLYGVRP